MRIILAIARLTFREAATKRVLLAAVLLGAVFLIVYAIGFSLIQRDVRLHRPGASPLELNETRNFLLMAGLYVVNFLIVMMSVLTSVDTLSGEISSGTVHVVATKPLRRREIVLGKFAGFTFMLTLYLAVMAGGVMAIVFAASGYVVPGALRGMALLWLNAILLLNVSLAGGAAWSTVTNGVIAFGLYGVAFIGGWIEHVGAFSGNHTAVLVGIVSSLIMPTEALWHRASFEMSSPLIATLGFSPFSSPSTPSPLMIAYAALYAAGALAIALRTFASRDL